MPHFGDVTGPALEQLSADTIRVLSAEGIQEANSGHPGLPMGSADIANVLYTRFLNVDPTDPTWINRDRFVLSAGHGSMLVYSLLHLGGFGLTLGDLKDFRQWDSKTPGHPELGHTAGVDTTTGPLGAGFSNAVGFAVAEEMLAARFNTADHKIVDHYTYVISGDGCMMEGVTSEAASLAGHLGLGKLIVFYDDNEISIEGSTDITFTENVNERFAAYNWHVLDVDGHDTEAIAAAVLEAKKITDKPSLIVCHTKIGKGSPNKEGKASAHGEPLGADELAATRKNLGWPADGGPFIVPQAVSKLWADRQGQWQTAKAQWQELYDAFKTANPEKAAEFERTVAGTLPENFRDALPEFEIGKGVASRASGGVVLNALADAVPELVGGSADLSPSTKTLLTKYESVTTGNFAGRNLHYGVREHAMGNISNGIAIHGGFIPYCATFMVFADYMRPTMRLAALMGARSLFYFTHDSIFVGEDGPTHQPIEHLASFRIIPNMTVMRPCDANEMSEALATALEKADGPTTFALTRQNLTTLDRQALGLAPASEASKGGYILKEASGGSPDLILLASGSEVSVALDAAEALESEGKKVRVVSMMSMEIFDAQDDAYRAKVLPADVRARVSIEASYEPKWLGYVGLDGLMLGMENYGASGPAEELADKYGFNGPAVVARVKAAGLA
ncbi:MAG: transketolase [Phycisphaerales bacterium]|jgi:transketolase|nr:transketolase [Phycisphaerales bacterium]